MVQQLTVMKTYVKDMAKSIVEDRDKYIGGSDAGAIFGYNPWKSPYALWCEKTGRISGEVPDNDAMRTGRDLEQYVAERFVEKKFGKEAKYKDHLKRDNYKYTLKEYPFMVGHIDRRVIGENAILECKTANSFQKSNYENGIWPAHYYAQCQHYIAVTGADRAYLAVLCDSKIYWKVYERDDAEIEALLTAESEFWEKVMSNTPPDIDGSESTEQALTEMYGNGGNEGIIDLGYSAKVTESLVMLEEVKKQIRDLKEIQTAHENIIKDSMGNNELAMTPKWKVTWKAQSRTSIDAKRLKQEKPEVFEEYAKESTSRVFRITEIKNRKESTNI